MINRESITEAILGTGAGPLALEEGAELVTAWMELNAADSQKKIVAVECGFVCWIDDRTVIIGVQDLLTDEGGIVGNEWKTTGAKTEAQWYDDIRDGSQVAIYAVALAGGTYYEKGGGTFEPRVVTPRIRVRAIAKKTPPLIWDGGEGGILAFTPAMLDNTRAALVAKAEGIRAMRRAGRVPLQLPGIWCTNKYRRQCEWYDECTSRKTPIGFGQFDKNDPAFELAFGHIELEKLIDDDLVILGASAYAAVSECAEKWRRNTLVNSKEDSMALQTGSVLHAGVAQWYREIRGEQNGHQS